MNALRRVRRQRAEKGAAIVEFALVMPILFILVLGIIQYGIYYYAMQSGTNAVGEAARRMSVGDCQTQSDVQNIVYARLGAATTANSAGGVTINQRSYTKADGTTSMAAPGEIGGTVVVRITFPVYDMGFLPSPDTVTRQATARIEDITSSSGGCQ